MANLQKVFCGNIKRIRAIKKISQSELAERMGILQTTLSRVENGKVDPGLGTLEKIANALEIPATELLMPTDTKELSLKEKLSSLDKLEDYDKKLLEAVIDNFLEKHRLEEQLQLKMKNRLDELEKVRDQKAP